MLINPIFFHSGGLGRQFFHSGDLRHFVSILGDHKGCPYKYIRVCKTCFAELAHPTKLSTVKQSLAVPPIPLK
jgi:hypothetical protein